MRDAVSVALRPAQVGADVVVTLAALAASSLPAIAATRVDPVATLRDG